MRRVGVARLERRVGQVHVPAARPLLDACAVRVAVPVATMSHQCVVVMMSPNCSRLARAVLLSNVTVTIFGCWMIAPPRLLTSGSACASSGSSGRAGRGRAWRRGAASVSSIPASAPMTPVAAAARRWWCRRTPLRSRGRGSRMLTFGIFHGVRGGRGGRAGRPGRVRAPREVPRTANPGEFRVSAISRRRRAGPGRRVTAFRRSFGRSVTEARQHVALYDADDVFGFGKPSPRAACASRHRRVSAGALRGPPRARLRLEILTAGRVITAPVADREAESTTGLSSAMDRYAKWGRRRVRRDLRRARAELLAFLCAGARLRRKPRT